jgi:hypothetical protein
LWLARQALQEGALENASRLIYLALAADPASPLVAVSHLQVLEADPEAPLEAKLNLGELYHQRYPGCVPVMLYLADWLIKTGEHERAVGLLHQAAILDVAGQTAMRTWGPGHPYQAMWPAGLEVNLSAAIPAGVASILGWNRLTGGPLQPLPQESKPSAPAAQHSSPFDLPPAAASPCDSTENSNGKVFPEDSVSVDLTESDLQPESQEIPQATRASTPEPFPHKPERSPVYVIFSTHQGLANQYGPQAASTVRAALNETARILNDRPGWKAMVFLPDDVQFMAQIGMKPVNPADAWQLKLSLIDLESALQQKNLRIGAVLIAGGPEVVPFHDLPNPVDDDDLTVPSDNPYTSSDENYFIPDWPVGRLPGGSGDDPALILSGLSKIRAAHGEAIPALSWSQRLWNWLRQVLGLLQSSGGPRRNSLALTA